MNPFNIGEQIKDLVEALIDNLLSSAFTTIAELLFTPEGLTGFLSRLYDIFLGFGVVILTAIILFKIIQHMLQASANGLPLTVGISSVLLRTIQACAFIILFPFIVLWIVGHVVYPLGEYMFSEMGSMTAETATDALINDSILSNIFNEVSLIILTGFLAIAMVAFVIKICIYQADLMLLLLLSVWAAISIAADENNYAQVWWREVLSQVVSIILQVVLMVLIVEILSSGINSWIDVVLFIGYCALIIRGPSVTRTMWYATGAGRSTMNGMSNAGKWATRAMMVKGK